MARRLGFLFTLVAAVFFVAMVWQLYQTQQAMKRGDIEREVQEAMGLVDLPKTLADQVLETLGLEWAGIQESPEPWGLEDGGFDKMRTTALSEEEAQKALHPSRKLRKFFLERMAAGIDTPGTDPVLNTAPMLSHQRGMNLRLSADMLSLLVLGRVDEALGIYRTGHRHARILARGLQGRPSLIGSMVAIAMGNVLDRAAGRGLELGLWPEDSLPRLAQAVREVLDRDISLDGAITSEIDSIGKVVDIVDRRLGPAAWPARLYWGNGPAQVEEIRACWKERKPLPEWLKKGRCHIMISIGMPSWDAAVKRYDENLAARQALLAKVKAPGGNLSGAGQ